LSSGSYNRFGRRSSAARVQLVAKDGRRRMSKNVVET
jgi:hypothetical protein